MARKNKRGGRSLVTEATRIHVREALDQFQASDAKGNNFRPFFFLLVCLVSEKMEKKSICYWLL